MKYFTGLIFMLVSGSMTIESAWAGKSCATLSADEITSRASKYDDVIKKNAETFGVDARLITAVITVESCFRPKARSYKGAGGLMQLMPVAAKRFGVKNRNDVHQNVRGGTHYIAHLIRRFKGDVTTAIAAYHAGEGNVDKHGGIPPFKSTRYYVKNVLKAYSKLGGHKVKVSPDSITLPSRKSKKAKKKPEGEIVDFASFAKLEASALLETDLVKQLLSK